MFDLPHVIHWSNCCCNTLCLSFNSYKQCVTVIVLHCATERWSSGNIFASFGSRVRRQLGESGKSDGLESMRDISEFLPDLEDMEDDQPDDQPLS